MSYFQSCFLSVYIERFLEILNKKLSITNNNPRIMIVTIPGNKYRMPQKFFKNLSMILTHKKIYISILHILHMKMKKFPQSFGMPECGEGKRRFCSSDLIYSIVEKKFCFIFLIRMVNLFHQLNYQIMMLLIFLHSLNVVFRYCLLECLLILNLEWQ